MGKTQPILILTAALPLIAQDQAPGGVSAEQVSKANNPLNNANSFSLQNYYVLQSPEYRG
jgi:hypothetical protein